MRLGSRSGHMLNLKQGKHLDTQKRRLRLLKHASEVLNSNQYNIKHLRRYHKMGHLNLGCLTPIRGFFFSSRIRNGLANLLFRCSQQNDFFFCALQMLVANVFWTLIASQVQTYFEGWRLWSWNPKPSGASTFNGICLGPKFERRTVDKV